MDTNAECSEIIKKLGEWLSISTNVEVSGSSLEGIHILWVCGPKVGVWDLFLKKYNPALS